MKRRIWLLISVLFVLMAGFAFATEGDDNWAFYPPRGRMVLERITELDGITELDEEGVANPGGWYCVKIVA